MIKSFLGSQILPVGGHWQNGKLVLAAAVRRQRLSLACLQAFPGPPKNKSVYRRSRLLFSSLRAHILEIISGVEAHIHDWPPRYLAQARTFVENFLECPNASERFRAHPNVSERIREGPKRSEQVQTRLQTYEIFEKLAKDLRKLRGNFANVACVPSLF